MRKIVGWFKAFKNPVPQRVTAEPGSPEFWADSQRFWAEQAEFWRRQKVIWGRISWMWGIVAGLLVLSLVLRVVAAAAE